MGRIGRETPDDTNSASRVKAQISDTLQEATDVLEQFELEVREAPKDGEFIDESESYLLQNESFQHETLHEFHKSV